MRLISICVYSFFVVAMRGRCPAILFARKGKKYEHRGKEQENGIAAHFHLCEYVVPVGSAAWGVPQPRAGFQSNQQQSLMMDIIIYDRAGVARVSVALGRAAVQPYMYWT